MNPDSIEDVWILMNATNHAVTVALTSKIAHLAVLIRATFADVRVDLKPWLTDTATQRQLDPHSIDLSFYFPKRHGGMACRCVLLQVRFSEGLLQPGCCLTHVQANGYDHADPQWMFSTVDGQFSGSCPPDQDYQIRFQQMVSQIFHLFESPNQVKTFSGYR